MLVESADEQIGCSGPEVEEEGLGGGLVCCRAMNVLEDQCLPDDRW